MGGVCVRLDDIAEKIFGRYNCKQTFVREIILFGVCRHLLRTLRVLFWCVCL